MIFRNKTHILTSLDKDARNFIDAAGLNTDSNLDVQGLYTAQEARMSLHLLVKGMKAIGTWDLCKAIYPFVGGTAYSHKWNLKDPRDLNEAFRLSFLGGGWLHLSTGAKPDPSGTLSYASTFLNTSTVLTLNSTHLSFYSGTNETTSAFDLASTDGTNLFGLYTNFNGNTFNSQYNGTNGRLLTTETRGDGYFLINRQSSSSNSTFRNGMLRGFSNTSTSIGSLPNSVLEIGRLGTVLNYKKEVRFATIGSGLTDQQAIQQSHLIETFTTSLRRNAFTR